MSMAPAVRPPVFDVAAVRRQFPALDQRVNDRPLVYLDNAASTQKPEAVIEAIASYYRHDHSNVHRGAHALADRATQAFEAARGKVAAFLSGPGEAVKPEEIVWTRGTTESINLVANAWGDRNLGEGDEILLTEMEHHANIVPWQMLAERTGARIRVVPVTDEGALDLEAYAALLCERTRLVSVVQVSNSLGTVNPVAQMARMAHDAGALVLVDGAQSVNHFAVDVKALDADFFVFSGHKLFGPTGIGVLYARAAILDAMPPWQGGGEMIDRVSFSGTTYNVAPLRFEAGTPHIAGAIGLGAAIDWLATLDREGVEAHERALLERVDAALGAMNDVRRVGTVPGRAAVVSFLVDGAHPSDVGMLLDQQGIAVRTGHHCTMPLMERFGLPGTVRASFSLYNTEEEVDRFITAVEKVKTFL
ncbi:MAG: cysteine desulfurase [Pseudomonadales bacterium]|jgi:cysteine desulfurase/selenocysteine lyase|nr:cysteine desulfurase [Pseudomonadales bacterium]